MSFFKSSRPRALMAFAVLCIFLLASIPTLANVMVAPKRIVFEGRQRSATVVLLNTSNETRTYHLTWKMMEMGDDGQGRNIETPDGPYTVPKMVVFSPRKVVIEPNGRQSIRLSLRRPSDLPVAEYRGHLVFSSSPGEEEKYSLGRPTKGIALGLKVAVGMSIPVIVRQGDLVPAEVDIEDISFVANKKTGKPQVEFNIVRKSGAASTYGSVRIFLMKGGKEEQIGYLPNAAFYPEQKHRPFMIPVTERAPPGSKIRITYEGKEEFSGRVFTDQVLDITK